MCRCWLRFFFFFSSRRRHTRWNCDWSSDVCSSDLLEGRMLREVADVVSAVYEAPSLTVDETDRGLFHEDVIEPSVDLRRRQISLHGPRPRCESASCVGGGPMHKRSGRAMGPSRKSFVRTPPAVGATRTKEGPLLKREV